MFKRVHQSKNKTMIRPGVRRLLSTLPSPAQARANKKDLPLTSLTAVSPTDGRYGRKTRPLRHYLSEFALIRKRVEVEVRWAHLLCGGEKFDAAPSAQDGKIQAVAKQGEEKAAETQQKVNKYGIVKELPLLSKEASEALLALMKNFTLEEAERVKEIEKTTNHDVKAVEYYLREKAEKNPLLKDISQVFHFSCTSEDINNLSYCLMLRGARDKVLLPAMDELIVVLAQMAVEFSGQPMLSRTHGQPATPTTLGRNWLTFASVWPTIDRASQPKLFLER